MCLLPAAGRVASGVLLLAAAPPSTGWAAPVPSGYESFGLTPEDFTTDPVAFHPRLLAKDGGAWAVPEDMETDLPPQPDGPLAEPGDRPPPPSGHPTTARWIGIVGFLLLLLRRSHRQRG